MLKLFLTFIAPVLLGWNLATTEPGGSHVPLMQEIGLSSADMMRYARRMERMHYQMNHEMLSFHQKANLYSRNIAQGLRTLENLSLDNTVGRHFEVATNQASQRL